MNDEPITFQSKFSLLESIERLRSCVRTEALRAEQGKPAVGVIVDQNVTVFWYPTGSMIVYAFKPTFKGQFADVDGRVILRGMFTMTRFSKGHRVLTLPGIVIIGVFIIFTLPVAALHHRSNPWELLLPMLGILLLGFEIWFAGLIERRWHRETDSLTKLISTALGGQ
ncbi:MAG: hypothetical protein DME19_12940 [Verrucomicrobia bacterium]|nr:MAG: hypothetical protein DME19_12940 [Verrucomicrobiota bacterium]